jgi:adenosylcobinamide-GDP ribazoletransferase
MWRSPYRQAVLAVQFASVFPTPRISGATEEEIRGGMGWLPVLGAWLGALLWGLDAVLRRVLPVWPATVLVLAAYTGATGALHLDGLMDTADAVGSRAAPEKALAIMKDSRVGAMGAVAGSIVLLGKAAALSMLNPAHPGGFILVPALSRLAMICAMAFAPAARPDGLAALFAQKLSPTAVALGMILSIGAGLVLMPWYEAVSLWAGTLAFSFALTVWFRRRFGGMTGDIYGALNELTEWLGWTALSLHGWR